MGKEEAARAARWADDGIGPENRGEEFTREKKLAGRETTFSAIEGGRSKAIMEEPQLDDDALIGDDEALETYERGDDAPMSSDDEEAAAAEEEQIVDMSVQGFFEHKDSVYIVAVDPSAPSHRVVSGGGDDMAYVWDMTTGSTLYRLSGHSDSIVSAGFSADGKYVATGAMDATVRVWKTDTGEFVTSLEAGDEVVVSVGVRRWGLNMAVDPVAPCGACAARWNE